MVRLLRVEFPAPGRTRRSRWLLTESEQNGYALLNEARPREHTGHDATSPDPYLLRYGDRLERGSGPGQRRASPTTWRVRRSGTVALLDLWFDVLAAAPGPDLTQAVLRAGVELAFAAYCAAIAPGATRWPSATAKS